MEGNNVETLLEQIKKYIPEGPQFYPADQVTDHPERFIVSELIREKALHLTREEIPHSLAVTIDKMERREDKDVVHVMATIIVERDSQKGIVIGKQGKMLKEIGKRARVDIENLLGSQVFWSCGSKSRKTGAIKCLSSAILASVKMSTEPALIKVLSISGLYAYR